MPAENHCLRPLMLANIAIGVAAGLYAMTIGQAVPALIALLVLAVGVYL